MKNLFITLSVFLIIACATEKDKMQSWLGHTKQDLVAAFGEPARVESDGRTGEIMMYAKQKNTASYYQYRIFYLTGEGKVYSWLLKTDKQPPEKINISSFKRY